MSISNKDLNWCAIIYAVIAPWEVSTDFALYKMRETDNPDLYRYVETMEMIRLRDRGYSYESIAEMMHISTKAAVFSRIKRMKLKEESRCHQDGNLTKAYLPTEECHGKG
jgi:hypothetical protein